MKRDPGSIARMDDSGVIVFQRRQALNLPSKVEERNPTKNTAPRPGPEAKARLHGRRPQASSLDALGGLRGESTVLAWALAHPGARAIIDDLHGRRCAEALGIPLRGTVGLRDGQRC